MVSGDQFPMLPTAALLANLGGEPGTKVDIYLSAGLAEDDGPSCDPEDQGNCGLYRLRWDLGLEQAVEVVQLAAPRRDGDVAVGRVEAAVHTPDGAYAWLDRSFQAPDAGGVPWVERGEVRLRYRDARGGGLTLDRGAASEDRPQWPWFYSPEVIVFSKAQEPDEKNLWSVHTDGSGLKQRTKFAATDISFGNPQLGNGMILSFGVDAQQPPDQYDPNIRNPNPHLTDVNGTVDTTQKFAVDWKHESYQHPTWNLARDRIVAGRHKPHDGGTDKWQELLYTFAYDGAHWTNQGRTFEPRAFEDLPSAFSDMVGAVVVYKYPHFCGDDRHLVATVYSRATPDDAEEHARPEMSRVLLIRLPAGEGGEAVYYDLTREVADRFPEVGGPRRWRGIFSVCRTVSG